MHTKYERKTEVVTKLHTFFFSNLFCTEVDKNANKTIFPNIFVAFYFHEPFS
mgnify:CR=1 FL=1